jgi:hypothetical protein
MTYATIHAVRFIILFAVLSVSFIFLSVPEPARAYFTTDQAEISLDGGKSALFFIEYAFGTERHDVQMPIFAKSGTEKLTDMVSYQVLDETGTAVRGKTAGIVLSGTSMRDGMYVVPKGTARKFTLVVVFTPEPQVPTVASPEKKYRLQVTHLPFNFDGAQQLQLNPSELQYYTTKLLPLR